MILTCCPTHRPERSVATVLNHCPALFAMKFGIQLACSFRLKNLQLGYTLPKGWLNSVGVENIRIYYSVENLLTFDKMKINIDPESTSQRLSSYPLLRTHAFGVNVTF